MLARMSLGIAPMLLLAAAAAPGGASADGACREKADVSVWSSPESPVPGEPLRLMVVAESVKAGDISVTAPGKKETVLATTRRGGPPFSFHAEVPAAAAGSYRVELVADGRTLTCKKIVVAKARKLRTQGPGVWENSRVWDRSTENLYSAWIEALFDAPAEESVSFPSLAPVIR